MVEATDIQICHQLSVTDMGTGELLGTWDKFSGDGDMKMYEVRLGCFRTFTRVDASTITRENAFKQKLSLVRQIILYFRCCIRTARVGNLLVLH